MTLGALVSLFRLPRTRLRMLCWPSFTVARALMPVAHAWDQRRAIASCQGDRRCVQAAAQDHHLQQFPNCFHPHRGLPQHEGDPVCLSREEQYVHEEAGRGDGSLQGEP